MSPFLLLLATASGSLAAPPDDLLRSLATAAGQGEPLYRVGLDAGAKVFVSSDRPFTIVDLETGSAVWKPSHTGEVVAVAEGAPEGGVATAYRIQVGAFSTEEAAEKERLRVEAAFGESAVVRYSPDRGSWRVRVGTAPAQEALRPLLARLREAGYDGVWIVDEPATEVPQATLRLVDGSYASFPTGRKRLAVVPGSRAMIRVGGKPYRGIVELRTTPYGTVRAVNWIELETYLRGVVPAELGPDQWPQLEALKAQAVAARTYAWRHRGQFEDEGFDLCALPRCQVYAGASGEHALSDQAVALTRGEILTHQGIPISALYTSTCGGHTEDAAEVFSEEAAPYLRGVPCRADRDGPDALRAVVRGTRVETALDEAGEDVTRAAALLRAAGVVARDPTARYLHGAPARGELRSWTTALADLAGLPRPSGSEGRADTLAQAAASLLSDLGWGQRLALMLSEDDEAAILRSERAASLTPEERRAVAYLAWIGVLIPHADGSFGAGQAPSRARIFSILSRMGERYGAFGLRDGTFMGAGRDTFHALLGKAEESFPLAPRPWLIAKVSERAVGVETLILWPGDRVQLRLDALGRVHFLELKGPLRGLSDDRLSQTFSWEVRKTRAELEASINRYVAVGAIKDLQVLRRGRSGRIVELRVVGSDGAAVVKGFDVRNLLDLRETLVVFEVQRDRAGEILSVVFSGKGWGHGVGLCQTGAYGMALRGKGYREILSHYYTGVTLESLPTVGAAPAGAPAGSSRPAPGAPPRVRG